MNLVEVGGVTKTFGDKVALRDVSFSVPARTDLWAAAAFSVMAVGFAPFAEEYLFRGLLFRALDREWGGWRAVIGSAAFFAVYHPPMAWLPVSMLGAANAVLFKRSGQLAPAVALHMAYNAVVMITS